MCIEMGSHNAKTDKLVTAVHHDQSEVFQDTSPHSSQITNTGRKCPIESTNGNVPIHSPHVTDLPIAKVMTVESSLSSEISGAQNGGSFSQTSTPTMACGDQESSTPPVSSASTKKPASSCVQQSGGQQSPNHVLALMRPTSFLEPELATAVEQQIQNLAGISGSVDLVSSLNGSIQCQQTPNCEEIVQNGMSNTISEVQDTQDSIQVADTSDHQPHQTIGCNDMYKVEGNNTKIGHEYHFTGPVTFNSGTPISQIGNDENQEERENERTSTSEGGSVSTEDIENAGIPPVEYNLLCYDICEELTEKQFKKLKFLLRKDKKSELGIPRDVIEKLESKQDLLECMEDYNYLSSTNTWFVQYLLYHVGNSLLYKKVLEFHADQLTSKTLFVCTPEQVDQGAGRSLVKLKIVGDIEQFRPIDVEEFRQLLAKQCGKNIVYISEKGQADGCIMLYFDVPSECKE
ncbi:uncharacterized protein [Amphiura filiformis]|uniref:uncharacterized protein n=1 Tax=Amphiura filiformis TaxID=82378 RepID=UPI003B217EB0